MTNKIYTRFDFEKVDNINGKTFNNILDNISNQYYKINNSEPAVTNSYQSENYNGQINYNMETKNGIYTLYLPINDSNKLDCNNLIKFAKEVGLKITEHREEYLQFNIRVTLNQDSRNIDTVVDNIRDFKISHQDWWLVYDNGEQLDGYRQFFFVMEKELNNFKTFVNNTVPELKTWIEQDDR